MNPLSKFDRRAAAIGFSVALIATTIVVWRQPRIYEVRGTMKDRMADYVPDNSPLVIDTSVCAPTVDGYVKYLTEAAVIGRVLARLSASERAVLTAPYIQNSSYSLAVGSGIKEMFSADFQQGILTIRYRHSDRELAARMVNFHMQEWVSFSREREVDDTRKAIEELTHRIRETDDIVIRLRRSLTEFHAVNSSPRDGLQASVDDKTAKQIQIHEQLSAAISRRREAVAKETDIPPWSISGPVTVPAENDYLIRPFLNNWLTGLGVAAIAGAICGVVFGNSKALHAGRQRGVVSGGGDV